MPLLIGLGQYIDPVAPQRIFIELTDVGESQPDSVTPLLGDLEAVVSVGGEKIFVLSSIDIVPGELMSLKEAKVVIDRLSDRAP